MFGKQSIDLCLNIISFNNLILFKLDLREVCYGYISLVSKTK